MSSKSILLYIFIWLFWLIALTWCAPVRAEVRIAVIDTGLDTTKVNVKVCENSSKNYVADEGNEDTPGHGTEVVNIVSKTMPTPVEYCIIPIKIFNKDSLTGMTTVARAIRYAVEQKADIVNLSFSGEGNNISEFLAVKFALDSNVLLVIAAGNDGKDLDVACNRYPVCHDGRAIVVGYNNVLSNTGAIVDIVTDGNAIDMVAIVNGQTILRSGSSFAAPRIVSLVAANLSTFKTKLKESSNKGVSK